MRARLQHRREFAQRVLPYHVAIVGDLEIADLFAIDVEVVAPELDHALVQLPLGERGAIERRFLDLGHDFVLVCAIQRIWCHAERRVVGRDERRDFTVVDDRRLQLLIQILAVSQLLRAREFLFGDAEGGAPQQPGHRITPDGKLRVGRRGCLRERK